MLRTLSAVLVSAVILTIWPVSGQEATPKLPTENSVCFHILVVPKVNIDSAMVLKGIEDPDKGMSLVSSLPPICGYKPKDPPAQKTIMPVPEKDFIPVSEPQKDDERPVKLAPGSSEQRGRLKQ